MIRPDQIALAAVATLAALSAVAGELAVTNAWSRSTPPVAKVGVVYFTLRNDTKKPDRLLKLSTPVAEKVAVHRTEVLDGIARMREVAVLHVDAGQTLELKPGGTHVMLVGLKKPLIEGTSYELELRFEVAGARMIKVEVRAN